MSSEILREYLVSLGFKVNTSEQRRVDRLLGGMDKKVLGLGAKALGAATAVVGMVTVFSKQMERMFYSARYADTTVEKLQGIEYGARGVGIQAGKMTATVKNFAAAIRGQPGLQGMLESLGVEVKGRTKEDVMMDFVKVLRGMPFYVAQQYAALFNMSPEDLFNMEQGADKMKELAKQREQMNRDAGLDMAQVTDVTRQYMGMWREVVARSEVFGQTLMIAALPAVQSILKVTDEVLKDWTDIVKKIGEGKETPGSLAQKVVEGTTETAMGDRVTLTEEQKRRIGAPLNDLPGMDRYERETGHERRWKRLLKRFAPGMFGNQVGTDQAAVDAVQDLDAFKSGGTGGPIPRPDWMKGPEAYARYKGVAPDSLNASNRGGAAVLFAQLEAKYGLPPGLLDKVWNAESSRGVNMRSPRGAKGHFGFMDKTAREYGLKDPDDLAQSATAAARKYRDLLNEFDGDLHLAAAAYNLGQGRMKDYNLAHEPYPKETRDYADKVAGPVTFKQDTVIHVHGVSDPEQAADSVVRSQKDVNADIIRNQRIRMK